MDDLFEQILSAKHFSSFEKDGTDIRQLIALREKLGLEKDAKIPLDRFVTLCNEKGVDVETCAIYATHLKEINELEE